MATPAGEIGGMLLEFGPGEENEVIGGKGRKEGPKGSGGIMLRVLG